MCEVIENAIKLDKILTFNMSICFGGDKNENWGETAL